MNKNNNQTLFLLGNNSVQINKAKALKPSSKPNTLYSKNETLQSLETFCIRDMMEVVIFQINYFANDKKRNNKIYHN